MVQKLQVPNETIKCFILLTNTAREALKKHFQDEHAFFKIQHSFEIFIEKQSIENQTLNLTFYFDPKGNDKLAKKFTDRVVIIDCAFDLKNGLVAKSFRTRGKNTPVETNRRQKMRLHLVPSRISGHTYSEKFISCIAELPVAQDRFNYINKRISSWEGYLKVQYKNASIDDIDATFDSLEYRSDFSKVQLRCQNIEDKQWQQLKGLSAYVKGYPKEIGTVLKANRGTKTVEIELSPKIAMLARKNEFDFTSEYISFSNASTKSQLNRLLKGFERLKEGLAANPNLENILFEDTPKIVTNTANIEVDFHNNLNEYQRDAVIGALSAEDLYVIQGPPGTGKTTVISEICYQNAKSGLKTLIASQSNLAVDNALGRLLSNKDIRILRSGRTDSIEEEGKKFIEENVASYWKKQTYEAISHEIQTHPEKEQQLNQEIEQVQSEIQSFIQKEQKLEEQIREKEAAQARIATLTEEISQLKKQIIPLKKEREKTEQALEKLNTSKEQLASKIVEFEGELADKGSIESLESNIEKAKSQLLKSRHLTEVVTVQEQLTNIQKQLDDCKAALEKFDTQSANIKTNIQEVKAIKKVVDLESYMERHDILKGYVLNQLFADMEKIHQKLTGFKSLKEISTRIDKAIEYNRTNLGIHVDPLNLPANHQYSLTEIDEFLTKLSRAIAQKKINKENGHRSIQGLYLRKLFLNELAHRYQALVNESLLVFNKMKEEVEVQVKTKAGIDQSVQMNLSAKYEHVLQLQQQTKKQLIDLTETIILPDLLPTKEELRAICQSLEEEMNQLQQNIETVRSIEGQLYKKQQELSSVENEITNGEQHLKQLVEQLRELNSTGIKYEKEYEQLEQLVKQNPEVELEKIKSKMEKCELEIARLKNKIEMLPISHQMQLEWKTLLEQATDHDLDEIRKLYVKHANVIGTTCVASANKEFMDNYPIFDVVIIDEVSKATPPELLLPMLKGKKVILVGDHHQLPPLIGDDTFEETLETVIKESDTFEEKRELEKLLEESLFERLYKNLPGTNKKMLAIQYRMHENIMESIAPFYQNGSDSLKCGLPDSDALRDHKLESQLINRQDHLLWVDVPNERSYFEERMKEGASLFNQAELDVIKQMLSELNEATALAKSKGLIPTDELKSVGVISFYAEQVKRINRLIEQDLDLPHLHIRTGSVDKFQGMEMDVILVSMVRNNDNKHGDIGFAKDYRRLNVALSRARELLVLIGSTDMFTKRPKKEETREMYQHLLKVVQKQNGYRQQSDMCIS